MLQRIKQARDTESGFTLIELLIVIVVLGILAGIVVFGVGTFRTDAKTAACDATKKTVEVAVDAYNAKNTAIPTLAQLVSGGYLKSSPTGVAVDSATGAVSGTC